MYAMVNTDEELAGKDGVGSTLVGILNLGVFGCPIIGVFYLYGYKLAAKMKLVQTCWRRLAGQDVSSQFTAAYAYTWHSNYPAFSSLH